MHLLSYKTKLILVLITLALLPITIVSLFDYHYTAKEVHEQNEVEANAILRKLHYELDDLFDDAISTLSGVSRIDTIQNSITTDPTIEQRLYVESLLDNILKLNSIFESYQIISPEGVQIYKEYADKSIEKNYLKNLNDRAYFTHPMNQGKPYISKVIMARTTNKPILIIGYPIFGKNNSVIGIVSGVINFDKIVTLISSMNITNDAYPFITSKEGLFLAHVDPEVVGKQNIFSVITLENDNKETIQKGQNGFVSYTYKAVEKFLYFRPDQTGNFILYYSLPKSDYFSNMKEFRIVLILVVIFASLVALLLTLVVSRKIDGAMERVREANRTVEDKNMELHSLASKLAKYLSPQLYQSIFSGEKDVKIETYRKKLTVFFSDIKDFSQITDSMQSEALSSLLNDYLNEMSKIALKYGGTIDKYIGDAIMIFFGDPETRGEREDAIACVSMAIEMRNTMNQLHELWLEKGISRPLKIRIGINTGYCTIGNFGSDERMDYTIIGGEVNLASRLESNAQVDSILISHETYGLIKEKIKCEPVAEIKVKGIAYPVTTYEVIDFLDDQESPQRITVKSDGLDLTIDPPKILDVDETLQQLENTITALKEKKGLFQKQC